MFKSLTGCLVVQFFVVTVGVGQVKLPKTELATEKHEAPAISQEVISIDTNNPLAVLKALRQQFAEDKMEMAFDAKSNSIVVTATDELHPRIRSAILTLVNTLEGRGQTKEDHQIKVFSLVNSDLRDTVTLLEKFFAEQDIVVDGDVRTQSLIVRGPESTLSMVEALLLKLDSEEVIAGAPEETNDRADLEFFLGLARDTAKQRKPAELRRRYEEQNRKAADLASKVRQLSRTHGEKHPQLQELKQDLRNAVESAFSIRQNQQKAEIAELFPKLQEIAARVKRRDRVKSQIIDRRVSQLLANTKPTSALSGPVRIEQIEGADTVVIRGKNDDVRRVTDLIADIEKTKADSESGLDEAQRPVPSSFLNKSEASKFQLPSTARDFLKALSDAENAVAAAGANVRIAKREIVKTRQQYEDQEKLFAKGFVKQSTLDDSKSQIDAAEFNLLRVGRELDRARQLVALIQSEHEASVRLLENEYAVAKLALEKASEDYSDLEVLFKSGTASRASKNAKQLELERARVQVEKTATLLKLLRSAGEGLANQRPEK